MNNKTTLIVAASILIASVAAFVFWPKDACNATDGSCESSKAVDQEQTRADRIQQEVADGTAVLVDVREPDEFASGHAKNAKLIPLGDVEDGKFNEDKDKTIYVYCRSGRRAGEAKTMLENQGYKKVENLGGLTDWQALGGEVVK